MSKPLATLALLTGMAAFAVPAGAGTLIPVVPFPGSAFTSVLGINNNNIVAGSYQDADGKEHGFFGSIDGNYTSFDYTANTVDGTELRGINDDGWVAGYAPAGNEGLLFGYEFVRKPDGTVVTIKKDGVPMDGIAQGITKGEQSVGDYWDTVNFIRYGYYAKKGKYTGDLTLPFDTTRIAPRGINSAGTVVGFFGKSASAHGFMVKGGVASQIDYPDPSAVATLFEGISDKGLATGGWSDADGNSFAFLYDTTNSTFTPFTVDGASMVALWGANKAGLIAVDTDIGSYIYCPKKPSKCPGTGGREISLGKPIRVPAGKFLHYDVSHAAATRGERVSLSRSRAHNGIAW
jgi:hypothetical protein